MASKNASLPKYTLAEELLSSISHGLGALLSVAALVVGVVFAALYNDAWAVVSVSIYGATLILLYSMSTIYHGLAPNSGKRVFQIIDHCSIFLLIAGTYTPITLVTLRLQNPYVGWGLFGVVWAAAILGIVLNAVDLKRFAKFSMICYIAMGWVVVFAFPLLIQGMKAPGVWLMVAGGLAYTLGAVLYGVGKKVKYIHSVWHFFVLAGSVLHYFSVLLYIVR